jgi:hypothetical protein
MFIEVNTYMYMIIFFVLCKREREVSSLCRFLAQSPSSPCRARARVCRDRERFLSDPTAEGSRSVRVMHPRLRTSSSRVAFILRGGEADPYASISDAIVGGSNLAADLDPHHHPRSARLRPRCPLLRSAGASPRAERSCSQPAPRR